MNRFEHSDIFISEDQHRHSKVDRQQHGNSLHLSRNSNPHQQAPKKRPIVLEPGTPCGPFEELLSMTKTVDNGVTSYLICKALSGPLLRFATENPPPTLHTNTRKQLPEMPPPVQSNLEPQLACYSAVTHQGMYRNYNEDKITIVIQEDLKWFGVYDGHGGDKCAQFLKDSLHTFFFKNKNHRKDPKLALRESFQAAEKEWLATGDKSGSCCIVVVVCQDICYVANVGDSRAILASEAGRKVYQITKDHKPSNPSEQQRIISAGGKVYQTTAISEIGGKMEAFVGPLRVFPGRLSITRTFGDLEAKDPQFSGNPNVVICDPEINSFDISQHNFIVVGSDGLWDRLENKQVLKTITRECTLKPEFQEQVNSGVSTSSLSHSLCGDMASTLLKESMLRGSTDNISVIVIGLPGFSQLYRPQLVLEKTSSDHIKVLSSISSPNVSPNEINKGKKKKQSGKDKENENFPDKMKGIDNKIDEINKNATRLSAIYPR